MECVYINLHSRPDRRRSIESSFARSHADGWTLSRFDAVDSARVADIGVPGSATPAEKGCFLSHRNLIRQHLFSEDAFMVLEDDAVFGESTCQVIDASLANLRETDWDIIFTDICVPDVGAWPDLVRLRRSFDQTRAMKLLSLARFQFAGATSYILNRRSRQLLAALMDGVRQIDMPYDLYLRSLAHEAKLKAFVIFPFVTSISDLAEQSSIQGETSMDQILNQFRRAMWTERDLDVAAAHVLPLRQSHAAPDAQVFGALFEAMLSDRVGKR